MCTNRSHGYVNVVETIGAEERNAGGKKGAKIRGCFRKLLGHCMKRTRRTLPTHTISSIHGADGRRLECD